ncbi:hypothetical protein RSA3_16430 [Microbacterium testaceum]|uniref:L,D-TPase catalytic domain-containing protein n=2 Tax=Microbacterium testaceum TaxID=2033 RepID=A0A147F387_MICTE|nr:hypothetical protein RSA3_16430 [Microbacterium testaceum]
MVVGTTVVSLVVGAALPGLTSAPPTDVEVGKIETIDDTGSPSSAVPAISAAQVGDLPEARYDAVVPGLVPWRDLVAPGADVATFTIDQDVPLYSADRATPVARLAARDFLDAPTTVVGIARQDGWVLVLTPARQILPSMAGDGRAPAQSAGWVPEGRLTRSPEQPSQRVVISVERQSVEITDQGGVVIASFPAGVGAADTPTPAGVTGYLAQRYVDPSQGTGDHPIQLTSLHSTAADEPYGGADGGLIGIHYQETATGAVSHGCIRLSADALAAINALPLGTLVSVV